MSRTTMQRIINIIVIINIIIILVLSYHIIINNKYSRKFVYGLTEKNINSDNFILEKEEKFVKEGKITRTRIIQKEDARREETLNNKEIKWYANDLVIIKNADEKIYYKEKSGKTDINGNTTYRYMTTKDVLTYSTLRNDFQCINFIMNSQDYKYLKKEKYNSTECIVVEFNKILDYDARIWIDLETGFTLKEELYLDGTLERITTYKVKINIVTDKEIDLPDLEEYTFIEK